MKNRLNAITALMVVVLGGSPLLNAQSATPAQNKIGVINIQAAIANTAEGKKVFADLQKKYAPRQQELQRLQQEIQAIQDQLTKQAATLSEEEQGRLSREAEDKQKLLKRSTEDAQTDFNQDRDETVSRIGKKMVQVIHDYAAQNGFTLVIDGAQIPIYYASTDLDITGEIIKRYDAANPVADAGVSAKPATPTSAPTSAPKPK
jgi:outer membrane protein